MDFGGDNNYKYRASILIFAVSHDLRPLVGFEVKLEDYCLMTEVCVNGLSQFFRDRNLNLAVTMDPLPSIYNTKYSLEWLRQQPNEDNVQWFGRIFGYWVPMNEEEFSNYEVVRNSMDIYVKYDNISNYLTSFDSLAPIEIPWNRLEHIRQVFNILGIQKGNLELTLSTRPPGTEDYQVAIIHF